MNYLKNFAQESTGAIRESIGTKIKTHLVPYEYIVAAAVGLNFGEEKYCARNFEKGMSESNLLASIERHLRALMDGEGYDEDSNLPHHVLLCSSVAMYVSLKMRGTMIEDMPPRALRDESVADVSQQAQFLLKTALRKYNEHQVQEEVS